VGYGPLEAVGHLVGSGVHCFQGGMGWAGQACLMDKGEDMDIHEQGIPEVEQALGKQRRFPVK